MTNTDEYKQVWDALSKDFNGAAFHVCCITDDEAIRQNGKSRQLEKLRAASGGWAGNWLNIAVSATAFDISGNMIGHAKARLAGIGNAYLYELQGNDLRIFWRSVVRRRATTALDGGSF